MISCKLIGALPTRLMAGLSILKHMHDLSDEDLCARWVENPYYQLFCGEEFFQHKLTFDRSSLTRWRQRMAEEKLVALIQESLSVATRTGAAKPADFSKAIVDTTVQPKAVAFPTDAKLPSRHGTMRQASSGSPFAKVLAETGTCSPSRGDGESGSTSSIRITAFRPDQAVVRDFASGLSRLP